MIQKLILVSAGSKHKFEGTPHSTDSSNTVNFWKFKDYFQFFCFLKISWIRKQLRITLRNAYCVALSRPSLISNLTQLRIQKIKTNQEIFQKKIKVFTAHKNSGREACDVKNWDGIESEFLFHTGYLMSANFKPLAGPVAFDPCPVCTLSAVCWQIFRKSLEYDNWRNLRCARKIHSLILRQQKKRILI